MVDWIQTSERMPEKADADEYNCVIAWHEYGGLMVVGWHRVKDNPFFAAWARTPEGPKGGKQ